MEQYLPAVCLFFYRSSKNYKMRKPCLKDGSTLTLIASPFVESDASFKGVYIKRGYFCPNMSINS